jgi:hypothetical protein
MEHPYADLQRQALARLETAFAEAEAAAANQGRAVSDSHMLSVPLSLRVSANLAGQLNRRAVAKHLTVSELVRRILTEAVSGEPAEPAGPADQPLTVEDVEQIARRVVAEVRDAGHQG